LLGAAVKARHTKQKPFEAVFIHTWIVGGLGSLIEITSRIGEGIELVDVGGSPVQKVDGLIPEWNLDASGPEAASSGMNVATKESCSMPGAGLPFEVSDKLGLRSTTFLAILALSLFFFPLSPAAFFFGAFSFDGLGTLVKAD
jgi:hypothetical protein